MLDKRRLAYNTLWNLSSNVLPLIAGIMSIPILIRGYGVDRFGVLTIAWMLIGYFSLFDMGLSRALTRLIAERLGDGGHHEDIPTLISMTLMLMLFSGGIGAIVLWAVAGWLASHFLTIPSSLIQEAREAFHLIALSLPFVIVTAGLRGILEAYQRFGMISLMRALLGVVSFVGPLTVFMFSNKLVYAVGSLLVMRVLIFAGHWRIVKSLIQMKHGDIKFDKRLLRPLLSFGSWLTISNIVGPLMVYIDRFVIGSALSVAAVAYYTTPYEIVTKLWVVPAALSGVLFPAVAAQWNTASENALRLVDRGAVYTSIVVFPVLFVMAVFAQELLKYWIGESFAEQGAVVLQWITAGVFINCIAQNFFTLIQGAGRADWAAKLHLAELLPYWGGLWIMLKWYGINGVAAAWFLRVTIDALVFFWMTKTLTEATTKMMRKIVWMSFLGVGFILSSMLMSALIQRIYFCAALLLSFSLFVWSYMIGDSERMWLRGIVKIRRG